MPSRTWAECTVIISYMKRRIYCWTAYYTEVCVLCVCDSTPKLKWISAILAEFIRDLTKNLGILGGLNEDEDKVNRNIKD